MVDSPLIRLLIGVVVVAAAGGFAWIARWRDRDRRARVALNLEGIAGRVLLFSDSACARCDEARAALETAGAAFAEVAHDTDPEVMRAAGVVAVPLIVARRADGTEAGRIAGKVSPRRLRRLLASAGL